MVNIRNLQGWLYSTSPQAEIKNKGGSRPQARTTVRKPRPQATGRRRMFHVKQKIKRVGPAHKLFSGAATLCPLTLVL
jgi:hypothetical protein